MVSRLYDQKGLDLLIELLPQLMAESHANFAILGSGDPHEEQAIRELSASFPHRIGCFIGFDDGLARRIFAGSDFFLMPSRFEPCGLAQQYAMRYGAPIARKPVVWQIPSCPFPGVKNTAMVFFFKNASAKELWHAIQQALEVFANNRKFTLMRKNALSRNCGWGYAAERYIQVYKWALETP